MAKIKNVRTYVPRLLGALKPAYRDPAALSKVKEALGVKRLLDARQLEANGDIADLPPDVAVYFASFGILWTAVDIRQERFSQFFESRELERIMVTQAAAARPRPASVTGCAYDTYARTWGVAVTGVENSSQTGNGIKVAILDSGIDLNHEAFRDLVPTGKITTRSFVTSSATVDSSGHGTHCAATICGALENATNRRFGIAPQVELFVAKILDDANIAPDARILQAIIWAVEDMKCDIVSMSIGAEIPVGTPHSAQFESAVARYAANVVFVAGVGNGSRRNVGTLSPVNHPANCPTILSAGAIDECKKMGNLSNRSTGPNSGKVGLVAPGLRVYSADANGSPDAYRLMDGTSAATAYVAGIAALWAQQSGKRGNDLRDLVLNSGLAMPLIPDYDSGKGLAQAPP